MKITVNQGQSILYKGVWFNQAETLDVEDLGDFKDQVTVEQQAKPVSSKKQKDEE